MPAPNELYQQYYDWNARINAVKQRGLNPAPAIEVGTQDLKRIYAGGTPRSTQDVTDQLAAAYTGQSQVGAPERGSGIGDLVGNFVKDAGQIITNYPGAIIHQVQEMASPAAAAQLSEGLFHPYDYSKQHPEGPQFPEHVDIGRIAKFDTSLPIIGGLIPGLWTLGSSKKQKMQHPLQSVLDILPFVSEAAGGAGKAIEGETPAATGSWQESLSNGKLAQAGLRATGITERATQAIERSPSFLSEYLPANKAVWRKYYQTTRAYTRQANADLYSAAQEDGVIPASMSMEESSRLGALANTYNDRFEVPPIKLTAPTLSDLLGRWNEGPGKTLPEGDIQAFSASPVGVVGEGPVTFSKDLAGPDAVAVRVRRDDLMFTTQPGVAEAHNIIPDITYDQKDVAYVKKYRDWAKQKADEGLTVPRDRAFTRPDGTVEDAKPPLVQVPTGKGDEVAIYSTDSEVGKKYNRWQDTVETANQHKAVLGDAITRARALGDQLRERSGKVRHFGETDEQFAARPDGPVDAFAVRDAAKGVADYFQQLRIDPGRGPIHDLSGDDGLFAQLSNHLSAGNTSGAKATFSRILRKMRTQAWTKIQGGDTIHDYVAYLRDEMTNITQKSSRFEATSRQFHSALEEATAARDAYQEIQKKADGHAAKFWDVLDKTPESRFHSLADQQLRGEVAKDINGQATEAGRVAEQLYQGENLRAATQAITDTTTAMLERVAEATRFDQLADLAKSKDFETMVGETVHDWRDLVDAGYNPVWLHSPDAEIQAKIVAGRITPLVESFRTPSFERHKVFSLANGKMDMAVGVTDAIIQKWAGKASSDFINWMIDNSGTVHGYQQLESDLRDSMRPNFAGAPRELEAAVQRELNRMTVPFQPEEYMPNFKTRLDQSDHYVIDRSTKKGLDRLGAKDTFIAGGAYNRAMNIWRVSVLTGPRHIVHVALGGLMFMMGQHPEAFTQAVNSFRELRDGNLPEEVTQGLMDENPDVLWQAATGKWMGNAFMQSLGKRLGSMEHAVAQFEQLASDWQRGMVYLSEVKKGMSSEEALAAVYKTFVDLDSLTPFERTVWRNVFPFWTFTKHVLSYVLTYPADHPLRAAILSSLVNQLTTDQASGEPLKLSNLFFLGEPDSSGNVSTVDYKNINPFRSIGGIGTLAGFLQGANPAVNIVARGLGYDPLGGVPMIYQPLTYDEYTGTEKATRPGFGVGDVAEQIVPEVSILDHFLGFTGQMRSLKQYSPAGYRAALFNALNLPFTYQTQNVYDIRSRSEHARYGVAQQAVSEAQNGNLNALDRFDYVPYHGYLYPAAQVKAYLSQYAGQGVVPKLLVPTEKRHNTKRIL